LLSDFEILTEKSGSVRLNEHTTCFLLKRFRQVLILVDPVDDEDVEEIVQRTDPPNV
jgi:tetrahydromethanopterin S-methyltransferase subunit A